MCHHTVEKTADWQKLAVGGCGTAARALGLRGVAAGSAASAETAGCCVAADRHSPPFCRSNSRALGRRCAACRRPHGVDSGGPSGARGRPTSGGSGPCGDFRTRCTNSTDSSSPAAAALPAAGSYTGRTAETNSQTDRAAGRPPRRPGRLEVRRRPPAARSAWRRE